MLLLLQPNTNKARLQYVVDGAIADIQYLVYSKPGLGFLGRRGVVRLLRREPSSHFLIPGSDVERHLLDGVVRMDVAVRVANRYLFSCNT